jgi:hypothetical protein
MKAPLVMFTDLVQRVRCDFYKGKPPLLWYRQQHMVKKALLYPARWLAKRNVELPAARYEAIVSGMLDTMLKHGNMSNVTWISRYILGCVQKHMEHHGDEYYREGVQIRNRVTLVMTSVDRSRRGEDSTIKVLAQADAVLKIGARKAKVKPVAQEPDLFL